MMKAAQQALIKQVKVLIIVSVCMALSFFFHVVVPETKIDKQKNVQEKKNSYRLSSDQVGYSWKSFFHITTRYKFKRYQKPNHDHQSSHHDSIFINICILYS
jgi:hypothetical protein